VIPCALPDPTHGAALPPTDPSPRINAALAGGLYATAAYSIWGLAPLVWHALAERPPFELLGHRIVWAMVLYIAILLVRRRGEEIRPLLTLRVLRVFLGSGLLLSVNWFTFIFAVAHEEVLQASLGYFLNPILNVVLGLVFLGERLRPGQWLAVALAVTGVGILAGRGDAFPWLALLLAFSFGFYGLVRKTAPADALLGSTLETALLTPVALLLLAALYRQEGASSLPREPAIAGLLLLTGAITAIPLLCFSHAARRLTLTSLGFFQYLAPTCQFLLAVLAFGEPFSALQLRAFLFIWVAVAIFTVEARLHTRLLRRPVTVDR
jgi:chloramphenicol-sensitive protein RarD